MGDAIMKQAQNTSAISPSKIKIEKIELCAFLKIRKHTAWSL